MWGITVPRITASGGTERMIAAMKKRKGLSRWQRWAKANPEKAARHAARRRKRTDRRNKTIWHTRLRLLMLHTGEFHTRLRDKYYQNIEVRLTVVEIAVVWFRDKAWTMKKPHLDRIDPEGHYEFENVRFIEEAENLARARNKQRDALEEAPF